MSEIKKCAHCLEEIQSCEEIFEMDNKIYHKDCVELHPIQYVVFLNDECIGTIDADDVQFSDDLLNEGEYIDLEEEE